MTYVDGYVIPIARENVERYKQEASEACERWMAHGALDFKECLAEDLEPDIDGAYEPRFPEMAGLGEGETLMFSWITFESRAHRDKVNAAVMAEFEEASKGDEEMPFDVERMAYAGFEVIVDGTA